jgi:hypothetical protein
MTINIEAQELHVKDLRKFKETVDNLANMLAKLKTDLDIKEIEIIRFDISKHCLDVAEKTIRMSTELTNAYYRQLGILTEMKLKEKFGD